MVCIGNITCVLQELMKNNTCILWNASQYFREGDISRCKLYVWYSFIPGFHPYLIVASTDSTDDLSCTAILCFQVKYTSRHLLSFLTNSWHVRGTLSVMDLCKSFVAFCRVQRKEKTSILFFFILRKTSAEDWRYKEAILSNDLIHES